MNGVVGQPCVGQWYRRSDNGESFQVTGYDEDRGTSEIQTADGDLDEIDAEAWQALPLGLADPPDDWTGVDEVEPADLGYSGTSNSDAGWLDRLQS